jgi:hypothetical protein
MIGLLFGPEDGSSIFHQNISGSPADYIPADSTFHSNQREKLKDKIESISVPNHHVNRKLFFIQLLCGGNYTTLVSFRQK